MQYQYLQQVKDTLEPMKPLIETTRGFMPTAEGAALAYALLNCQLDLKLPAVEIGSYMGLSTLYLGAAARKSNRKLISIDHHHGSEENQAGWEHHDPSIVDYVSNNIDTLYAFRRTMNLADLERTVIIVVSDSKIFSSIFQCEIGFLFIDGGHGEIQANSDFESWTPKITSGGLLAIHDVFENPKLGGRPPYELYLRALQMNYREVISEGSLRVMRKN